MEQSIKNSAVLFAFHYDYHIQRRKCIKTHFLTCLRFHEGKDAFSPHNDRVCLLFQARKSNIHCAAPPTLVEWSKRNVLTANRVVSMFLPARAKMAVGSISASEFHDLALKMAEFSNQIRDTWIIRTSPKDKLEIFLEKSAVVEERLQPEYFSAEDCSGTQDLTEELETAPDPSCVEPSALLSQKTFLSYNYHVIYSHSYSVPVLYFNVSKPDGKRLSLEELWCRVPGEYQHRIQDHKWATLTQQEHPYLGSPFFMLHPCHTASLMSQVPDSQDKRYYLIKWLSSVGPVVGLNLSPAYATAFDSVDTT